MYLLLTSMILAIPTLMQERQPAPAQGGEKLPIVNLDGTWTVTYAEMEGKKPDIKGFTQLTIKDNVVTCRHEGKEKSWRLQFGPHHMVRCTEIIDGKQSPDFSKDLGNPADKNYHTHHGVYIASQDYFCLCLHKGRDQRLNLPTERRGADQGAPQPQPQPPMVRFGEHGPHAGQLVLILHRASGTQPSAK